MRRRAAVSLVAVLLVLGWLLVGRDAPPGATGAWMAAYGLEPRFETLEGLRVRYLRGGSGEAVLLLHGFASSIYTWKDVVPALAASHDVIALDLPGFGGSDQPPDLSVEVYPAAVTGLMDRLGIAKASLVGHSLGGAVAVQVAARAGERVERLVLIDPAGFNLSPADRPAILRVAASGAAGALAERLRIRRLLVRIALHQVFHDDALVTPERVEEYAAPLLRPGALVSVRSLLASGGAVAATFPETLARVRAPALILWGREDRWAPVEHAARFAAALPGSQTVLFDACGHVPQEERPAEVARRVAAFLDAGAPSSARSGP